MSPASLVTGGSGYVGSVLARTLLAKGESCRVFDLADAEDRSPAIDFQRGDIRDAGAIRRACQGVGVVYHCVAQVPLARGRARFESVNVSGTATLLGAAHAARVRKVVVLSSSAIFGIPATNPVTETTEPRPVEAYGRAKLGAERVAERVHRDSGLDVTILRPRTVLGPGRLGIFQLLFEWVARGRDVYVLGGGENRYQFVHAEDLADACIRAAARPGFAVYNVGTDRFGTMRESLQALIAHAGTGSRVRSLPVRPAALGMKLLSGAGLAPFAPYHWAMYGRELYFDIERARSELGWTPRWSNVDMLCQAYDWYVRHGRAGRGAGASPHRSPVREGLLRVLRWLS